MWTTEVGPHAPQALSQGSPVLRNGCIRACILVFLLSASDQNLTQEDVS